MQKINHAQVVHHWRKHPEEFARQLFGVDLDVWQLAAMTSLNERDLIAVRSCHGVGKTAFFVFTAYWWILTRTPCLVVCTAPSSNQLENVLWSEFAKWRELMPPGFKDLIDIKSESITFTPAPRTNRILARTARRERPEAFQGFHDPNMLFIADEASGVDDIIFETGWGSMTSEGAKVLLAGNPTRRSGFFFDAFHKNAGLWKTFKVGYKDSKLITQNYVDRMAHMYGEDSNIFRVRVLGEFPTDADDVVIPLSWMEDAVDRPVEQIDGRILWGLDVGMGGDDSALAKRNKNVLLDHIKTWSKSDLMQTVGIVVKEYNEEPYETKPHNILVDAIGIGAGVAHRLKEQGLPARAINVSESSSSSNKYVRLRDQLWWQAREWFQERDCRIPDDKDLIAELSTPMWQPTSAGKILVEAKKSIKRLDVTRAASGRSPNRGDAFIMTFAANDTLVRSYQSAASVSNYGGNGWLA